MPANTQAKTKVRVPYCQDLPSGKFRYRRRVPPDMVAAVGKLEWVSKPIADEIEAHIVTKRLTKIHDDAISRFRNGGTYEEQDAIDAIEARADEFRSLRPEAIHAEFEAMGWASLRRWVRGRAKAAFADLEAEHGSVVLVDGTLPPPADLGNAVPIDIDEFMSLAGQVQAPTLDLQALNLANTGGRYMPSRLPLSLAYKADIERATEPRDEKRIKLAVDCWIEACGDSDFMNLQRPDVEKFVAWAKKKGWAPATVKRRVVSIQGIHKRLRVYYGLPDRSVWQLLKLKGSGRGAKLPFNGDHLAAIDAHLAKGKTTVRVSAGLALMRYAGMGPKEIVGLRRRDLQVDAKIPHVIVRINEERGLKTGEKRERTIVLLGPALDGAKAILNANNKEYPFESQQGSIDANGFSQALNAEIREAGIPKCKRLTAYSFRHGIAEAMQQARVTERLRHYVMGHAGHGVHESYGSDDQLLTDIRNALKAAHKRLGNVALSQYEENELIPKRTA